MDVKNCENDSSLLFYKDKLKSLLSNNDDLNKIFIVSDQSDLKTKLNENKLNACLQTNFKIIPIFDNENNFTISTQNSKLTPNEQKGVEFIKSQKEDAIEDKQFISNLNQILIPNVTSLETQPQAHNSSVFHIIQTPPELIQNPNLINVSNVFSLNQQHNSNSFIAQNFINTATEVSQSSLLSNNFPQFQAQPQTSISNQKSTANPSKPHIDDYADELLPWARSFSFIWFHLQGMKRKHLKTHDTNMTPKQELVVKHLYESKTFKEKQEWIHKLISKLQKDVKEASRINLLKCVEQRDFNSPCVLSHPDNQGRMRRIDCLRQSDKIWRLDIVASIIFRALPLENTDAERIKKVHCKESLCINPYHFKLACRELDLYIFATLCHQIGKGDLIKEAVEKYNKGRDDEETMEGCDEKCDEEDYCSDDELEMCNTYEMAELVVKQKCLVAQKLKKINGQSRKDEEHVKQQQFKERQQQWKQQRLQLKQQKNKHMKRQLSECNPVIEKKFKKVALKPQQLVPNTTKPQLFGTQTIEIQKELIANLAPNQLEQNFSRSEGGGVQVLADHMISLPSLNRPLQLSQLQQLLGNLKYNVEPVFLVDNSKLTNYNIENIDTSLNVSDYAVKKQEEVVMKEAISAGVQSMPVKNAGDDHRRLKLSLKAGNKLSSHPPSNPCRRTRRTTVCGSEDLAQSDIFSSDSPSKNFAAFQPIQSAYKKVESSSVSEHEFRLNKSQWIPVHSINRTAFESDSNQTHDEEKRFDDKINELNTKEENTQISNEKLIKKRLKTKNIETSASKPDKKEELLRTIEHTTNNNINNDNLSTSKIPLIPGNTNVTSFEPILTCDDRTSKANSAKKYSSKTSSEDTDSNSLDSEEMITNNTLAITTLNPRYTHLFTPSHTPTPRWPISCDVDSETYGILMNFNSHEEILLQEGRRLDHYLHDAKSSTPHPLTSENVVVCPEGKDEDLSNSSDNTEIPSNNVKPAI